MNTTDLNPGNGTESVDVFSQVLNGLEDEKIGELELELLDLQRSKSDHTSLFLVCAKLGAISIEKRNRARASLSNQSK